jgi:hypothetical protein
MNGKRGKILVGLALTAAVVATVSGPAPAQEKELSDKSVLTLMKYAWTLTPQKFTASDGKVIEVDKTKPGNVVVPPEIGREVIRTGRLSALAQRCNLPEEQTANYQTLMRRERAKGKWNDQQLLYIHFLHLFTVMLMTGKVQLVEADGDKQVQLQDTKPAPVETCPDAERKRIQEQIMAYVKADPQPAAKTAQPKTAQPKGAQKK